jgi:hypothetical protein
MKKVLSLLMLLLSLQTINAHAITSHHTHDSLVGEWAWILLPCIALGLLMWKLGAKNYFKTLKK